MTLYLPYHQWRQIWIVFLRGCKLCQASHRPGSTFSLQWHTLAPCWLSGGYRLAEIVPFLCKDEQLLRNAAFGVGPTSLMFHHHCLLACQKGAKRNECHTLSVSTSLIILSSERNFSKALIFAKRFYKQKSQVLFVFVSGLTALLATLYLGKQ